MLQLFYVFTGVTCVFLNQTWLQVLCRCCYFCSSSLYVVLNGENGVRKTGANPNSSHGPRSQRTSDSKQVEYRTLYEEFGKLKKVLDITRGEWVAWFVRRQSSCRWHSSTTRSQNWHKHGGINTLSSGCVRIDFSSNRIGTNQTKGYWIWLPGLNTWLNKVTFLLRWLTTRHSYIRCRPYW